MKIITSIYVYNFHLIISSLNEGVQVIPFKDNRSKFYNSKVQYSSEIKDLNALTELNANKHVLYAANSYKLTSISLLSSSSAEMPRIHQAQVLLDDISQLSIDYKEDNLYAISDNKGIVQIDISHSRYQEVMSSFVPPIFEKIGNPSISNIEAIHNHVLVAIRDFGILSVKTDKKSFHGAVELRTDDPQDVKYLKLKDLIAVADSEEGIILYAFASGKRVKNIKLPNDDFPQQIEVTAYAIIIKGTRGLYVYYLASDKILVLREGKIGALAIYYDYIFFTSKGKVFSLTLNNSFESHGFIYDKEKIDLELIRQRG